MIREGGKIMMCPFRKVVISEVDHPLRGGEAFASVGHEVERKITREEFRNCCGEDCQAFSKTVGCKMLWLEE